MYIKLINDEGTEVKLEKVNCGADGCDKCYFYTCSTIGCMKAMKKYNFDCIKEKIILKLI